jgi:membrane protein required for colicin V production
MIEAHLNLFDMIVFAIIGLSALLSFYRGFVREFFSLSAWIGALVITLYAFPHAQKFLTGQMDNKLLVDLMSSVGTYLTTLLTLMLFTSLLMKFLKPGKEIGIIDNLFGLVFGLLRGLFIISLGFLAVSVAFDEKGYPDYIQHSISRPYVEKSAKILVGIAPGYLEELKPLKGIHNTVSQPASDDTSYKQDPNDLPSDAAPNRRFDSMEKLQQMINEQSPDRSNDDE